MCSNQREWSTQHTLRVYLVQLVFTTETYVVSYFMIIFLRLIFSNLKYLPSICLLNLHLLSKFHLLQIFQKLRLRPLLMQLYFG